MVRPRSGGCLRPPDRPTQRPGRVLPGSFQSVQASISERSYLRWPQPRMWCPCRHVAGPLKPLRIGKRGGPSTPSGSWSRSLFDITSTTLPGQAIPDRGRGFLRRLPRRNRHAHFYLRSEDVCAVPHAQPGDRHRGDDHQVTNSPATGRGLPRASRDGARGRPRSSTPTPRRKRR